MANQLEALQGLDGYVHGLDLTASGFYWTFGPGLLQDIAGFHVTSERPITYPTYPEDNLAMKRSSKPSYKSCGYLKGGLHEFDAQGMRGCRRSFWLFRS